MEKVSIFLRTIFVSHAPTYYDCISDYKFLYAKNEKYFVVKYHYYNGLVTFSTLIIPNSSIDSILIYEKENENLYGKEVIILDNYKSILDRLPNEDRKEIEENVTPLNADLINDWQIQRDEENIRLLLKAYELSGNSLIDEC